VDDRDGIRRRALLWGAEAEPFTFFAAGKSWALSLRKERYEMPFAIQLERFSKEDHPGIDMPKSFASDVKVANGTAERDVRISMNEPLRDGGLVLYQASWGPSNARPGERLFSTLAVVRNPADHWPLAACLVIAAGLLFHFGRMLVGYVRVEMRSA
jgi:cytochrome c biogenesis protein ResB